MSDWVVVTGGAGFIGSNFVRYALEHSDARVLVIDKLTYAGNRASLADVENDARFDFLEADVADRDAMQRALERVRPRAIVNFAAETHVDRSIDDPEPFVMTNLVGTFVLLECARRLWTDAASPGRFLHVSTDEVYGTLGPSGAFSETTPYAPNSPYAATKAGADHLVRAYHRTYQLPVLVTNCSNNYGPYQFPEKLIPLVTLNALEARALPIYGDGLQVRDWLYVLDHCDGILRVLERGRAGEHYNIGGQGERTNLAVVDAICDGLEAVAPAGENPAMRARGLASYRDLKTFVEDRPGHDRRYAIDAEKIRTELGWTPRHGFDAGIADTVAWFVGNRGWCEQVQASRYDRERLGLAKEATA